MEKQFPFKFEDLTEDEKKILAERSDREFVRVVSTGYVYSKSYRNFAIKLYNFLPRKDDIWLVGYPRSGTTLTQEILYLLETDLDYERAASDVMDKRFPFLEDVLMRKDEDAPHLEALVKKDISELNEEELKQAPSFKSLEGSTEKRFIKSHMGFNMLPPDLLDVGCKVVFVVRNFKDCIVSEYFYPIYVEYKRKVGIYGMWQLSKKNLTIMGNYFEILKEAWKRRNNKNLLFLYYEEFQQDRQAVIQKISNFLGKNLTDVQLDDLLGHTDIKSFKTNKSLNNDRLIDAGAFAKSDEFKFIRQGKTGGWREQFTKEMNAEMDEWLMKNFKEMPDFKIPPFWKKAMDLED